MKKPIRLHSAVIFLLVSAGSGGPTILSAAEDVPWGVASQLWPETLGSQRARIQVDQKADAVWIHFLKEVGDPIPIHVDEHLIEYGKILLESVRNKTATIDEKAYPCTCGGYCENDFK